LKKIEDVKTDSNCGFCIVTNMVENGDSHRLICLALHREISLHKRDYISILNFETHLKYIRDGLYAPWSTRGFATKEK